MDSNHRSITQQIYSLSPLATRESTHYTKAFALAKADDRTRTDNLLITNQLLCQLSHIGIFHSASLISGGISDPNEIRTRVTAVKGRCLNRLTMGP